MRHLLIPVTLTPDDLHRLKTINVERVLRTTIQALADGTTSDSDRAHEDWTEANQALRILIVKLYLAARMAAFKDMP